MSKELVSQVRLRVANESDLGFIFNSWLKSFRSSDHGRKMSNPTYYTEHHKVLERIISCSQVIVACSNEDPSQIYGWICAGEVEGIFCLHFVYVKHAFRGLGLGTLLLNAFEHEGAAGLYTHHTPSMDKLKRQFNLIYHPYIWINDYLKAKKE